jgi:hypothetical protein
MMKHKDAEPTRSDCFVSRNDDDVNEEYDYYSRRGLREPYSSLRLRGSGKMLNKELAVQVSDTTMMTKEQIPGNQKSQTTNFKAKQ